MKRKVAHFSDLEMRLLDLLPKDGSRISSTVLVDSYYADEPDPPFNRRKVVIGRLRVIADKAVHNDEPWRLCKTERAGPHSMEFWIEGEYAG